HECCDLRGVRRPPYAGNRNLATESPLPHEGYSSNLIETAPAWQSVRAWLQSFPVYGRIPCGRLAPPVDQGFLPCASRRCQESASRRAREQEMPDSRRGGRQRPWENVQRFAGQSRRHRDVGVVLREAFSTQQ